MNPRFIRELIQVANRQGFDYNIVEAFNQPWKSNSEGVVGANWGLLNIDREPVFPLTGPVMENPDLAFVAVPYVNVRASMGGDAGAVRDAAYSVLGDWPTPDAAPDLLALAKAGGGWRDLGLRGYIRLIGSAELAPEHKMAMCNEAAALVAIPNAGGRYSTKILPDPDAVFKVKHKALFAEKSPTQITARETVTREDPTRKKVKHVNP